MHARTFAGPLLAVSFLLVSGSAAAALTSSEKAQVRDFITAGRVGDAAKIRSLVARTDLSTNESVEVVSAALKAVPLDAKHEALLKELMFGQASAASRPVVVEAVTRALLARADGLFEKAGEGLDRDARATTELARIYAFLDAEIANAGTPMGSMHDTGNGIPQGTYDACAKALRDHIAAHARWLKGASKLDPSAALARAQAHIALFDMLPDGVTRKVDAADRLGLSGARRQMLVDWGILLADDGTLSERKAESVMQLVAKFPGARRDLEVLALGDVPPRLVARGLVLFAPRAGARALPAEVTKPTMDPELSSITESLADLVSVRALAEMPELRAQVERDALMAHAKPEALLGSPRAPSVESTLGAAIALVSIDAERAVERAFGAWLHGNAPSAALLSDALGAMDGRVTTKISAVRLAPQGYAVGFTLGGHAWAVERPAPDLVATRITKDGAPIHVFSLGTVQKKGAQAPRGPVAKGGEPGPNAGAKPAPNPPPKGSDAPAAQPRPKVGPQAGAKSTPSN